MDVSQMTDEALVDDCCVAFADAYDPSSGLLANVEAKVRWESHKAELLRRLALRDQQVTLAMAQEAVDVGLVYAPELSNWLVPDLRKVAEIAKRSLAQLPWPQGSGEASAEGRVREARWGEPLLDPDEFAASTQDAPTEVEDGE